MATKKGGKGAEPKQTLFVGLGTSAGGLDALKAFFKSFPEESGMTFIVHLSPDNESNMAELLQAQTSLKVLQVNEKVDIESEHIYVIPPQKMLTVEGNHLELAQPERQHVLASIDLFFRSLAETKGKQSACVIMSGRGNDGTKGMKRVKEAGGLTIAQDPKEAQYPEMPQSAIETGFIDFSLPIAQISDELVKYKEA